MRNILLKNHAQNVAENLVLDFLTKKIKIEHIFRSTVRSFIQFVFIVCPSKGLPKDIETKVLPTWFYFI